MSTKKSLVALFATLGLAAGVGVAVRFETPSAHAGPSAAAVDHTLTDGRISDVAEKVVDSVVNVASTKKADQGVYQFDPFFTDPSSPFYGMTPDQGEQQSLGSGVIVSAQGRILTNAHV